MGIFEILSFGLLEGNNKWKFQVSDAGWRSHPVVKKSKICEQFYFVYVNLHIIMNWWEINIYLRQICAFLLIILGNSLIIEKNTEIPTNFPQFSWVSIISHIGDENFSLLAAPFWFGGKTLPSPSHPRIFVSIYSYQCESRIDESIWILWSNGSYQRHSFISPKQQFLVMRIVIVQIEEFYFFLLQWKVLLNKLWLIVRWIG